MPTVPQRVSLVATTESVLIEGITQSRWRSKLPAERQLCDELKVSRGTLRGALKSLAHRRFIRIEPGRPCAIVQSKLPRATRPMPWRIGFISPIPQWMLTSFVGFWFSELRSLIHETGGQFEFYSGERFIRPDCGRSLEVLVKNSPHDCWILHLSTAESQRWFFERQIPAIVTGSLYDGITLPSIAENNRALGRHAAGAFLARGHSKIALLAFRADKRNVSPGVLELEQGAREACAASGHDGCEIIPVYYNPGAENACRALDRILTRPRPPTAFLCAKSASLLTALTYLAQRGIVVPRDISMIVTQHENFLPSLVPEPAHYRWSPGQFASALSRLLQHAVEGTLAPDVSVRLMPRFVSGKSLGRLTAAAGAEGKPLVATQMTAALRRSPARNQAQPRSTRP